MFTSKQALDELILETFRFHGLLIAAGDALTRDLGLSSARWQVLGAVGKSEVAPSLSAIARTMGLSRQAVRRVVNELEAEGMVETKANPANRRLRLVFLTAAGRSAHDKANAKQVPWAERLAEGIVAESLLTAAKVMRDIRQQLEANASTQSKHHEE
ncbi:MAG TPA: MarR family transcriptional regulator [Sphingomonadaceae bacterium]|jgi:DNA-binding MarR family transcriptional regulator|nr:MarR family transcriptional regulator [Sphingomonadaceae bacterium]